MLAVSGPQVVVGFLSAVGGAIAKGGVDVWLAHRNAQIDQTKFAAGVSPEPAKVVFDAQQAALVMSEQMRHDLRDQVERCQVEIEKLKDENDKLDDQMKAQASENAQRLVEYRKRVEVLEEELFDMGERLKREGQGEGTADSS